MIDIAGIIALAAALFGGGGIVGNIIGRRKVNAEAFATETDARHIHWEEAESIRRELRDEIDRVRQQANRDADECRRREATYTARIEALERALNERIDR